MQECKNCNQTFESKYKQLFCSRHCSCSFNNKHRQYDCELDNSRTKHANCKHCSRSIMISIRSSIANCVCAGCRGVKDYKCQNCSTSFKSKHKKKFCCNECMFVFTKPSRSKGGRNSAEIQSQSRRSRNEIYFATLCEEKFVNVLTNAQIFNGWDADVVLPTLKVAVMWNGIWHYKQITSSHSVSQVQNRDKIKIDNIIKCGYIPYVVSDLGSYNPAFVKSEFHKFECFLESTLPPESN